MTAWGEHHGTRVLAVSNSQECLPCRMVTSGVWVVISRPPEIWISYFQKQIHILWFSRIAWVRILQLHNLDLSKTQNKFGIFFSSTEDSFLNNREKLRIEECLLQQKKTKQTFSTYEHVPLSISHVRVVLTWMWLL